MIAFFKKIFRREPPARPRQSAGVAYSAAETMRVMPRHWRLRLNGVHGFVLHTAEHGRKIVVSGWHAGNGEWRDGDYFIFVQNGGRETRYRIEKISRPGDPHDQYFADCVFAPRGAA